MKGEDRHPYEAKPFPHAFNLADRHTRHKNYRHHNEALFQAGIVSYADVRTHNDGSGAAGAIRLGLVVCSSALNDPINPTLSKPPSTPRPNAHLKRRIRMSQYEQCECACRE